MAWYSSADGRKLGEGACDVSDASESMSSYASSSVRSSSNVVSESDPSAARA